MKTLILYISLSYSDDKWHRWLFYIWLLQRNVYFFIYRAHIWAYIKCYKAQSILTAVNIISNHFNIENFLLTFPGFINIKLRFLLVNFWKLTWLISQINLLIWCWFHYKLVTASFAIEFNTIVLSMAKWNGNENVIHAYLIFSLF